MYREFQILAEDYIHGKKVEILKDHVGGRQSLSLKNLMEITVMLKNYKTKPMKRSENGEKLIFVK